MRGARAILVTGAVALVLTQAIAPAAQSSPTVDLDWAVGQSAPAGATRWDGAVVGDTVYFLGFRAADNTTDGSIWTYDIPTATYADTGLDMPVAMSNYTVAPLKDNTGLGLYVFGGRNAAGETATTVQVFYPATGTALVLESDPWPGTTVGGCTSLAATGVTTVGKRAAYVVGGTSFSTSIPPCADDNSDQVWRFDPKAADGSRWIQVASLGTARGYLSPVVVGKKLYAVGGNVNTSGTLAASQVVEAWKIGSAAWDDAGYADLPAGQACDETQAFGFKKGPLAKTITVAGCGQWPTAIPDVVQYDIAADSWSTVGALNEARRNHAGANLGSKKKPQLAVFGGYNVDGSVTLASSEIGTVAGPSADRPSAPTAKPPAAGRVPLL